MGPWGSVTRAMAEKDTRQCAATARPSHLAASGFRAGVGVPGLSETWILLALEKRLLLNMLFGRDEFDGVLPMQVTQKYKLVQNPAVNVIPHCQYINASVPGFASFQAEFEKLGLTDDALNCLRLFLCLS